LASAVGAARSLREPAPDYQRCPVAAGTQSGVVCIKFNEKRAAMTPRRQSGGRAAPLPAKYRPFPLCPSNGQGGRARL